jgi:hypothetical protein
MKTITIQLPMTPVSQQGSREAKNTLAQGLRSAINQFALYLSVGAGRLTESLWFGDVRFSTRR